MGVDGCRMICSKRLLIRHQGKVRANGFSGSSTAVCICTAHPARQLQRLIVAYVNVALLMLHPEPELSTTPCVAAANSSSTCIVAAPEQVHVRLVS
jgi:hypothetical protein